MSKANLRTRLDYALAWVRGLTDTSPVVGVILGSGMAAFADRLENKVSVPYEQIPGMPVPKVAGHPGRLALGNLVKPGGTAVPVAVLMGRGHAYEGHAPEDVAFGARVLCGLGVKGLVLTNAAGGVHPGFEPGDLVRIVDHIDLSGTNPLVGENDVGLGPRFVDLTQAYDRELGEKLEATAKRLGIQLKTGVYACMKGPSYETPAEVRMLSILGADLVGMSTVPEVIVARHMGVPVLAFSVVTNRAAGLAEHPLSHAEVEAVAGLAREKLAALLTDFLLSAFR